jgi:arginyl-tRNA synthetase
MSDYALQRARQEVAAALRGHLPPEAELRLIVPPPEVAADLALPCFPFAKALRRSPNEIAAGLAAAAAWPADGLIGRAEPAGGYLNFHFQWDAFANAVLEDLARLGDRYGGDEAERGTVAIDLSSPNIAKPMSVGHLRSTVIGDALRRILSFLGYRTVGINHLGDWGTQFGKVIYAFREWGDPAALRGDDAIKHLLELYVRFHREEKDNPEMEDRGREWFRRLENGDPEALRLWEQFRALSVRELERIYALLGVRFDSWHGEAFFEDKMAPVVAEAEAKGLAVESDGALVIPLDAARIRVPLMLRKRDGTSTYATRDLAAALYRIREYGPSLMLYAVGTDQKLHFQQLFEALRLLGHADPPRYVHVDFGMMILPEGTISTREGRIVFLEEVLEEAVARARAIVAEKNPDLDPAEQAEIARRVGIGAVKYADLSQTRTKNVTFEWDRMLSLDGDAAPYLQFAYVRCRSILRRAGEPPPARVDAALLSHPIERELLRRLALYPEIVREAGETFYPHVLANHLYRLAQLIADFCRDVPVLRAETPETRAARLALVRDLSNTLRGGLLLLGIECPEQM